MTPNPKKAKLKIIINQGMGTTITTQVNTALTEMTHQINTALGKQLLQTLSKKMPAIPAEMASNLTNPLTIETEKINKTGDLANGGAHFFQFSAFGVQLLSAIISSFVIGYGVIYLQSTILNVTIPNFTLLGLFLSLCAFSFIIFINGVESWVGLISIPIFMLLLFFAAPLLTAIPESLNGFYSTLSNWLPMSYMYRGVKSIMYFNNSPSQSIIMGLIYTIIVGLILVISAQFKKDKKKEVDA